MAAAAVVGLLMAGGCGGDTCVLIEISRDDTVPERLGRLELHIGVGGVVKEDGRFVDVDPEEDVRVDGRDLARDPYRVLLRPHDYPDSGLMVAVVAYANGEPVGFGSLGAPVRFADGEVRKWQIVLRGQPPDGFFVTDTDCVVWVDAGGSQVTIGRPGDQDCDGWLRGDDCNDLAPGVNPGAGELCGNQIDEDCDGQVDEDVDEDGDQVTTCGGDCDDGDASVGPTADEVCDGVDNDCNGLCDENLDGDGDGYTACGSLILEGDGTCLFDPARPDCDDGNPDVNPGAFEVCDGIDNDCDGICDNGDAGLDRDGDRFTACGSVTGTCGLSELYADCQDEDPSVHPGAPELCDGVDDDCDDQPLQRTACFAFDGLGGCFLGAAGCSEGQIDPPGIGDCAPAVDPVFNQVLPPLCDAYDLCSAVGDPDPYTCSIAATFDVINTCSVAIQVDGPQQCPGQDVVLPDDGLIDCTWVVIGGMQQGGDQDDYLIGLRPLDTPDATPAPSVGVCRAALVVTPRGEDPPSPHVVLLARYEPDIPVFLAVSLEFVPVDRCEPPRGLECDNSPLQ